MASPTASPSGRPRPRRARERAAGPVAGFVVVAALALACAVPAAAQPLPAPVADAVRTAALSPAEVGIAVVPLDGRAPLLAHNPELPFNPASTMKLVTTYAALSLLGPDYRWTTSFAMRGALDGDVLRGDLVLRGGGDPKLVIEDMTELVGRLRAAGLREIRGDLVIDDALYEIGDESYEKFDGDPSQPYNVRPHAALMNFKATRVVVRPEGAGVAVALDPPLAGVPLVNEVKLVKGACRFGAWGLAIRDAGPEERPSIKVGGAYSAGCGEQSTMAAVLNHRQFIQGFFLGAWQAAGGAWSGRAVVERRTDPQLPVLAQWTSPRTLADVVRDINKFSNNVMARQVMLQTSADPATRQPATLERARQTVARWLERKGLRTPELVIDNGSGLSRTERISAGSMARLLVDAARSDQAAVLQESLPVVGVDGTMKGRLRGEPIEGRAWIKTGSLNDVRSIAGYVDAASGRRYAVVMLVNGPRAPGSQGAQDALLRWVHANG
ncbi:MAG: D-alanyl-D-alanine carboxypeptidase dacC precursor [Pseudomonadota bacterium]|jgi:D-alanyl-D-alanine carboxypeptidase/D-alanyl-D-alanine-endopeptidase (penicillin-binding protein 4)